MPVKSIKRAPSRLWIPPTYDALFKINIVTSSETIDITDDIITGGYTDGITETIGNFTFTIDNMDQTYTDKFNLNDEIKIYSDYAKSATTLRFTGIIEKVNFSDEDIILSGQSVASKLTGINVTYNTTDYTHSILSTILTNYTDITQTNIDTAEETDTITIINWYQKPFWECVIELCTIAGYDAYIDCNLDFHYFVEESRENTTEAVVHDSNLIQVNDFTPDLTNVKNKIIVYGAEIGDVPILWTSEDSDSIASYGVKEQIINDTNIITIEQAQYRVEYELSNKKNPPIMGEVSCDLLATILPGERIQISDPVSTLNPDYYNIQKFTHRMGDDEQTILTIQKEQSSISKILKKRIVFESESMASNNSNEMLYSWIYTFDTNVGICFDAEIVNGILKTDGGACGTWISPIKSLDSNITSVELRVSGDGLSGTTYFISSDAGTTYQSIPSLKTLKTLSPPGQNLRIKIIINSATTQIKSVGLMYK